MHHRRNTSPHVICDKLRLSLASSFRIFVADIASVYNFFLRSQDVCSFQPAWIVCHRLELAISREDIHGVGSIHAVIESWNVALECSSVCSSTPVGGFGDKKLRKVPQDSSKRMLDRYTQPVLYSETNIMAQ